MPAQRFKVNVADADLATRLEAVPGIGVTRQIARPGAAPVYQLVFGRNAIPIVNDALRLAHLPEVRANEINAAAVQGAWAKAHERLLPGLEFKGYQPPAIDQMFNQGRGLIRAPCGSGKSLMGLVIALGIPGRWLIITRAANRAGYIIEMKKWTRNVKAYIVTGLDNKGEEIPDDVDFAIVSVETLQFHSSRILRWMPHGALIDESDLVKSVQRWKAVPKEDGAGVDFLRRRNRAATAEDIAVSLNYCIETTATPFPNSPKDGFAQGDLMEPGAFGKWRDYATRYCARRSTGYGPDDSGADHLEELAARWAAITHEVPQAEVNREMPPVRVEPAYIPKEDQTSADDLREEIAAGGSQEQSGLMLASAKARGYALSRMEETVRAGAKVAIFTGWRADAERMAGYVAKRLGSGVRRGRGGRGKNKIDAAHADAIPVVLIHGQTGTSSGRIGEMEPFINAPGGGVLVGTIDALGRSIDGLQCVALALFMMLPWRPGDLEQAIGRFPRLGRVVPCLIELLVALGSYAEHVVATLLEKVPAIAKLSPSELTTNLTRKLYNGAGTDRAFANILAGPDVEPVVAPRIIVPSTALDWEI